MKILRSSVEILTLNPSLSSKYTQSVMGDETVTLQWEQPTLTALQIGDYIDYAGIRFTLNKLDQPKKVATNSWQYTAVFESPLYDLLKANYMLFDGTATPPQGEFPLTGTPLTFITLLVANLNRVAGSVVWFVGDVVDGEAKTLTFSNEKCYAVLSRLADEYETEYKVSGNTIHLSVQQRASALVLEYGSTLYDIERVNIDSSNIVTRLYPFGSTRNIASGYRSGSSRLLIPDPALYLENNIGLYGVIEECKTFEDIYPRLSSGPAGTVTGVGSDIFTVVDANLDFDVNAYMLGIPTKLRFLTGQCAGYDLQIAKYIAGTKTFTLIQDVSDKDYEMPNPSIYPAIGDTYVLLDIEMPEAYVIAAEAELLAAATEYLNKNSHPKVTYRGNFSALYAKVNAPDIRCGDVVPIQDDDFGISEEIRIVKLTRGIVDNYNIQFDLSDTVVRSTLSRITSDIKKNELGVKVTNLDMKQRFNAAYRNLDELRNLVFDTDGYFDPANIKPLSVETTMLSVGAKSQQLQTDIVFSPNDGGDPTVFAWSAGSLVHFGIDDTTVKTWNIAASSVTGLTVYPLYIYARCSQTTSTGTIVLSATANKFDYESGYWSFLLGVLHTPVEGVCGISLTYGQTVINGQYIRTGVISSVDGTTYFNLNTGDIVAGANQLNGDGSGQLAAGAISWNADGTGQLGDGSISWNALQQLIINMTNFKLDVAGNVDIYGKIAQRSVLYTLSTSAPTITLDGYNVRFIRESGSHATNINATLNFDTANLVSGTEMIIIANNFQTKVNVAVTGYLDIFSNVHFLYPVSGGGYLNDIMIPAASYAIIRGIYVEKVNENTTVYRAFYISSLVISTP